VKLDIWRSICGYFARILFFGFLLNQLVAEIRKIIINQALIDLSIEKGILTGIQIPQEEPVGALGAHHNIMRNGIEGTLSS
jgi:hypothetical protein